MTLIFVAYILYFKEYLLERAPSDSQSKTCGRRSGFTVEITPDEMEHDSRWMEMSLNINCHISTQDTVTKERPS